MKVFDIEFYRGDKASLVRELSEASQNDYSYIVTPNVNHIVQLEHNKELRRAYSHASLRICDSKILLPVLNRLKANIAEAIPGSTLTESLVEVANREGWTITVIGCEDDVVSTLRGMYPNIVFNHHNPPMGFIDNPVEVERCVSFVVQHPARLIFFSVGCPRQEALALKVYESEQAVGVGLCVGASLNFLSGKIQRAPEWMQHLSLEWLHRICMEPRRLVKRYVVDAYKVFPIIVRQFKNKQSLYVGRAQQ